MFPPCGFASGNERASALHFEKVWVITIDSRIRADGCFLGRLFCFVLFCFIFVFLLTWWGTGFIDCYPLPHQKDLVLLIYGSFAVCIKPYP